MTDRFPGHLSRREVLKTSVGLSAATALAGCPEGDSEGESTAGTTEYEATPVGLTRAGMGLFNVAGVDFTRQTRSRSWSDGDAAVEADVTSHIATYGVSDEADLPRKSLVAPSQAGRGIDVVATPTVEESEQPLNPLARMPLEELVNGERGRQTLARLGLVSDTGFDWIRAPERVGANEVALLNGDVTVQSFHGIATAPGGEATQLLMHVGRTTHEETTVLVVGAQARRAVDPGVPPEGAPNPFGLMPVDEGIECLGTDACDGLVNYDYTIILQVIREMQPCQVETSEEGAVLDCGGSVDTSDSDPHIRVSNARAVQKVEQTTVDNPDTGNNVYTQAEPDLVAGDNATVVFDLTDLQNVDELPSSVTFKLFVTRIGSGTRQYPSSYDIDSFELPKSAIQDIASGTHTIAKLHELAVDDDSSNDLPVFSVPEDLVDLELVAASRDTDVVANTDNTESADTPQVTTMDSPLKIGFIAIMDPGRGSNYGNSNGRPRDFPRAVSSGMAYLQRILPGDVIGYRRDATLVQGETAGDGAVDSDLKLAKEGLDQIIGSEGPAGGPPFPQGGEVYSGDLSRSDAISEIENGGFDVTVAIIPWKDGDNPGATDYFSYHGKQGTQGKFKGHNKAVCAIGAGSGGNDDWSSSVLAQEVGHYFQKTSEEYGSPSNKPKARREPGAGVPSIDTLHARVTRDWDAPILHSIAYDLEDGTFGDVTGSDSRRSGGNVQSHKLNDGGWDITGPDSSATSIGKLPSFMSYSNEYKQKWTDAAIHQHFVDNGWDWPNGSGGSNAAAMLSVDGTVDDSGEVTYDSVTAYDGFDRYVDQEDGTIRVSLYGPTEDEPLEEVRVRQGSPNTHGSEDTDRISAFLPFARAGVSIETVHEELQESSRMNPIVRGVEDAVKRVPDAGYRDTPAVLRDEISTALEQVAAHMEEARYADAAETMNRDVRRPIAEGVREDYDSVMNHPSRRRLLGLVDEMVDRLEGVAGGPSLTTDNNNI